MAFYVRLCKVREDAASAGYAFSAGDGDAGEAIIDKASGDVTLTRPLGGSIGAAVGMRAAAKLRNAWRSGPMPEVAEWAS